MSQLNSLYPMGDPMGPSLAPQAQGAPPQPQQVQPPPQAPQGPPPPPPEPLSQAEQINLSRYQQGLAWADSESASGSLHPETAGMIKQRLQGLVAPLKQRQEAAAQAQAAKADQKALENAMKMEAQREAIQGMNLKSQAKMFPETVTSFTDPATGQTEHLYPNGKGGFQVLKFEAHSAREERMAAERGGDTIDYNPLLPIGAETEQLKTSPKPDEPPTLEQAGQAMRQSQPLNAGAASPGTREQVEAPLHGQARTPEEWGRIADQKAKEAAEKKAKEEASGVPPIAEYHRRAQQAIPRPTLTGNPLVDHHNMQQWNHEISTLVNSQVGHHLSMVQHRETLAAQKENAAALMKQKGEQISAENRIKAEEKVKAAEEKKAADAEKERQRSEDKKALSQKARADAFTHHLGAAEKEYHSILKEGGTIPEHLATPEAREEFAARRADKTVEFGTGKPSGKPDASGLPTDVAGKPSSINHSRVRELLSHTDAWLADVSKKVGKKEGGEDMAQVEKKLTAMKTILKSAADSGQPLTIGQRKRYEDLHGELGAVMKAHATPVDVLRPAPEPQAPPPVAPAPGAAQPPAAPPPAAAPEPPPPAEIQNSNARMKEVLPILDRMVNNLPFKYRAVPTSNPGIHAAFKMRDFMKRIYNDQSPGAFNRPWTPAELAEYQKLHDEMAKSGHLRTLKEFTQLDMTKPPGEK